MQADIRPATGADVAQMTELLLTDAAARRAHDPQVWPIADDARDAVARALTAALSGDDQPVRQQWLVADHGGALVGLVHSMRLPVPPIYAGLHGDPGLLLPEALVTPDAPAGTIAALIEAAEADLRASGAEVLLASFVTGDAWRRGLVQTGYRPLTLYLAKTGFDGGAAPRGLRPADEADIGEIVALSARNRAVLAALDGFWSAHRDADERFDNWMRLSLTFDDRDMLVDGSPGAVAGYAIAQPATRLHFPAAHDISAMGFLDDYFHTDFADPTVLHRGGARAQALLAAAERAFAGRGKSGALVVCPAAWRSKIALLEGAGYRVALTWMIKR